MTTIKVTSQSAILETLQNTKTIETCVPFGTRVLIGVAAGMAELVDARDLKSLVRKGVRVRFPLPVPLNYSSNRGMS